MERVIAFVDGFNLYHSLDNERKLQKYKWLNLRKLLEVYIPPNNLREIYYFTALTTWDPDKMVRHKILIKAFESTGIKIVYGEFRTKDRFCPHCRKTYRAREEKQTDVNIAIHLFRLATEDRYDRALILSGDSDLLPSIKAVQSIFPSKKIGVLIPIGRKAEALKNNCDFHMRIREKMLQPSVFDDVITLADGSKLTKPPSWS